MVRQGLVWAALGVYMRVCKAWRDRVLNHALNDRCYGKGHGKG